MKLDKAVEFNKEAVQSLKKHKFHDHADAVQIGIEAIKEIQGARDYSLIDVSKLLPGETPEDDPS